MGKATSEIGMVGLGVMGRNLLLNMAEHGFTVSGYDKDSGKVQELCLQAGNKHVFGADSLEEFILPFTINLNCPTCSSTQAWAGKR